MNQTCNCIEAINKLLRDQNTKGGCELLLGLSVSGESHRVYIATQNDKGKIEAKMGANYCPFCGAKYDTEPDGARLITLERRNHRAKGWAPEHDDSHKFGELALAAACYATPSDHRTDNEIDSQLWPDGWEQKDYERIRELTVAGALIAAEIDRLQRQKLKKEKS